MSQQEFNDFWASLKTTLLAILPLIFSSAVVSVVRFFENHWRAEPFKLSKLVVGIFIDTVYGTLIGGVALAAGRHVLIACALSGAVSHYGMRHLEQAVLRLVLRKYGLKDNEKDV